MQLSSFPLLSVLWMGVRIGVGIGKWGTRKEKGKDLYYPQGEGGLVQSSRRQGRKPEADLFQIGIIRKYPPATERTLGTGKNWFGHVISASFFNPWI